MAPQPRRWPNGAMRATRRATAVACAVVLLAGGGCATRTQPPPVAEQPSPTGDIPAWGHDSVRFLGPADELGEAGLLDAMGRRGSVRDLSGEPLTDRQLAALLWSAQGVSAPSGARTVPSAGALYPLETYVVTPQEVLRYVPRTAAVEVRSDAKAKIAVTQAISGTPAAQAYAIVVITGVPARITGKYAERGIRYMWMEAGHAAQNLLLAAAAMGLGAVTIGAFDDAGVATALTLTDREIPLYLIPVGRVS
jgi:SagB-type dehydrogenase family enzyme